MDLEPYTQKNTENEQKKTINDIPTFGHVFKPDGVRRNSDNIDQINRFLIKSQFIIVLPCSIFL